jgi:O-methyltransferase involved in polyketide biosynthesis
MISKLRLQIHITDVPETMLWTLHNRASEAIRIYQAIDYDYERSFGKAEPSHAIRSLIFDRQLKSFLKKDPHGVIVNLGEGLETQRFRVGGEDALWSSIDLPEAMTIHEQFIQPDDKHQHLPLSALDRQWFDAIPDGRPVFITAQGLLINLPEHDVQALFRDLAERFPGVWFMFDVIPKWISQKTVSGFKKTEHYTVPKMPCGINRDQCESILRMWVTTLQNVEEFTYARHYPRGAARWLYRLLYNLPILKNLGAMMYLVQFGAPNH